MTKIVIDATDVVSYGFIIIMLFSRRVKTSISAFARVLWFILLQKLQSSSPGGSRVRQSSTTFLDLQFFKWQQRWTTRGGD